MSGPTHRSDPRVVSAGSSVHPAIRWTFYLFVLSLPFEYPERSFPVETTTITAALFLLAVLVQPVSCFRRFPASLGWFAGFLYACLVSFVVDGGQYADEVQRLLTLYVQMLLLFWAEYNVLQDEDVFRKTPLVLAIACIARAGLQLADIATVHTKEWVGGERVSALGQNTNQSSMMMAAGLVALLGLAHTRAGGRRYPWVVTWPCVALIGLAIIQNGSRGGLAALGVGVVTFALGGSGMRTRLRHGAVGLVALGLLIWGTYSTEGMRNRLGESASTGRLAGREQVYPALWHMFLERPILGYGPQANKWVLGGRLPEQHYEKREPHNLPLEIMTSTGLVGLIPFLIGFGLVVRAAWRARRGPAGSMPLALLASTMTANMSGSWLAGPLLWFVFAYELACDRPAAAPAPVLPRRSLRSTPLTAFDASVAASSSSAQSP